MNENIMMVCLGWAAAMGGAGVGAVAYDVVRAIRRRRNRKPKDRWHGEAHETREALEAIGEATGGGANARHQFLSEAK